MGRDPEIFEGLDKERVLDVLRRLNVAVSTIGKFTYLSQGETSIVLELEDRLKRKALQGLCRTFDGVYIHYFFHPEMIPSEEGRS